MKRVRKAVIPAAGYGTRFLPATKAQAKEMLPIIDTPTIQFIVEEAVKSGIEEILIITSSTKKPIEDHFDRNWELENALAAKGKNEELKLIETIAHMARLYYVRQQEQRGLGDAIAHAEAFVGDEPFAILLGDDVVVHEGKGAIGQLIEQYEQTGCSVVGVQTVADKDVNKYGIVSPVETHGRLSKLDNMVEKPKFENAPSNQAVLGRYILTPKIFDLLKTQELGAGNEVQLTDAIKRLMEFEDVYAYDFEGKRYDIGSKIGFLEATVDFALKRPELKDDFVALLKDRISKL